jgi:hypothetical protein
VNTSLLLSVSIAPKPCGGDTDSLGAACTCNSLHSKREHSILGRWIFYHVSNHVCLFLPEGDTVFIILDRSMPAFYSSGRSSLLYKHPWKGNPNEKYSQCLCFLDVSIWEFQGELLPNPSYGLDELKGIQVFPLHCSAYSNWWNNLYVLFISIGQFTRWNS